VKEEEAGMSVYIYVIVSEWSTVPQTTRRPYFTSSGHSPRH
jgi:hypothetical protein